MDTTPRPAALRLPTEPYPGLRPFLDHEAALLLGRSRQVREIIERLRETRFVAVIGGSGSGKSSLIRAGVVPELRGFGIKEAGDYWIPVVCTPGTTLPPSPQADPEGGPTPTAQTPITRLAWKFSQLLNPLATPDADAQRRSEVAAVFRQEAGFARLVDAYFDELPARGPDAKDARFLFVIDQFEELFHPNNRDNPDARRIVEAVIDHFFNPHPRCYVVLTMRSEHLADCAGFLELPDAINKSSYLVRRLDERELREAIVGPAKVYLRLLQRRGAAPGTTLPADVVFDAPVIERLLADVERITSDADHLPLLQHVLARNWEAACQREGLTPEQVPARVIWADLEHAVAPLSTQATGWLHAQAGVNALRRSLENQAEAIYQGRSTEQRALLDVVLRHLAFKDPNNGLYSQQRIDVDDPRLFDGIPQPRETLHALLRHGFLDSVNYLFWDKENPERVTLKVSHESFIRGWAHFRVLIDAEAERFEEFVGVLRKCAMGNERPEYLLEASELARLESCGLRTVFENPLERRDWFRVLLQYRDGERLARVEPQIDAFLAASRARQRAQEQERLDAATQKREAAERDRLNAEREREFEAQRRQAEADNRRILAEKERAEAEVRAEKATAARKTLLRRALVAGIVGLTAVLVGLTVLWWAENDLSKKERTLHRSYALAAETQVGFASQFSSAEGAQTPLYTALLGASLFDEGFASSNGPAEWPLLNLMYAGRLDAALRTQLLSEVRNASALGTVLRGAAWTLKAPAPDKPVTSEAVACESVTVAEPGRNIDPRGARFFARPGSTTARGLIVVGAGSGGVSLYAGRLQGAGRECSIEDQLMSTPLEATRLALAADLSNVVVGFAGYRQFYSVLWVDPNGVQMRQRAVVTRSPDDTDAAAPGGIVASAVEVLGATPRPFATDLTLGGSTVRLFDLEPVPITTTGAMRAGAMALAVAASPCGVFARASADAIRFTENDALLEAVVSDARGDSAAYCLHLEIANYRSPKGVAPTLATLYRVRGSGEARAIESQTPLFNELVLGAVRPDEVRIDTEAGWLAFRGAGRRWRAIPWGLEAWRELAGDVFDAEHKPAPEGMFNLIVGGVAVPDVGASVKQHSAGRLPSKAFVEPASAPAATTAR
ncbi:MAG: hypothetical protein ABI887_00655 [Burkholderiales bacterium]